MGDGRPLFPTLEAAESEISSTDAHTDHIDLRIRPIGRPKVSTDSVLGFQRVTRRYVVEGPHASKSGISKSGDFWIYSTDPGEGYAVGDIVTMTGGGPNAGGLSNALPAVGRVTAVGSVNGDITNLDLFAGGVLYTKAPTGITVTSSGGTGYAGTAVYEPALFRPIGEPDIEFPDHYLVNQQVEPSKSMDKAYLTREFVKLRDTWYAESSSESGNLTRITRKYAVLRQDGDYLKHLRARSVSYAAGVHPFGSAAFPHGYTSQSAKDMEPYMGYSPEAFSKLPVDKLRTPVPGGQNIFPAAGTVVATASVDSLSAAGGITGITVDEAGEAYEASPYLPRVLITGGGGKGAAATVNGVSATGGITGITVTNAGSGYIANPTVTIATSHEWKQNDQDDPWDFIPRIIGATEPSDLTQANTAAAVAEDHPLGYSGFLSGSESAASTATVAFTSVPLAGSSIIITDAAGKAVIYTAAAATSGTRFLADTTANATAALTTVINSSAGHDGTIIAVDGPTGTVTLTQNTAGTACNVAITGSADTLTVARTRRVTFTGFSGGSDTTTLTSSLSTLGASGAADPVKLKWLRANASVDTSNPGIDLWSCSWVAPVEPFWITGTTSKKGGFKMPVIVDFDEDGPRVSSGGTSTGGVSQTRSVSSFTYFLTGTHIPVDFTGGGGSSSNIPIVNVDLRFVSRGGDIFRIAKTYTNALFRLNTSVNMAFTDTAGSTTNVAKKSGAEYIWRFNEGPWKVGTAPIYQNRELAEVGGVISWSHTYPAASAVGVTFAGASVKPIHSHKGDHVWQVTVHYA